jgi:hypothetical protein
MGTRLIRVLPALDAPRSKANGPECIFPLDAAFRFKLVDPEKVILMQVEVEYRGLAGLAG